MGQGLVGLQAPHVEPAEPVDLLQILQSLYCTVYSLPRGRL